MLKMEKNKQVYFNEFNVPMGKTIYIPLVSGILQSYAQSFGDIVDNYTFMPFMFYRDKVESILSHYDRPKVAVFSASMWNEQLCLKVSEAVKNRYPDCLIIFGGPQVPYKAKKYFERYPFIDITTRGEGEQTFVEILRNFIHSKNFSNIPGISWQNRKSGEVFLNKHERPVINDLDVYPSPYLNGLFDDLIRKWKNLSFQAIIETNRGCSFSCSYCFWGQGGLSRKFRFHSIERIKAEIEWLGRKKISYVFCADSNFGMHPRDLKITKALTKTKKKYKYPEKFRVCYGKNTDNRIFEIVKLLHKHEMDKGITLSRQSNDPTVLKNVRRSNIKMSTYRKLQGMSNKEGLPVYTELILGLPGENYRTWVKGIEEILSSGLQNQLFIYQCQVLPNTELAETKIREGFEISTMKLELNELHGSVRQKKSVHEYEEIIITTKSMPLREWKAMTIFSWTTMVMHSLKLGFYILLYLKYRFGIPYTDFLCFLAQGPKVLKGKTLWHDRLECFEACLDRILSGKGRLEVLEKFGDIYWDQDEACFLHIIDKLDLYYEQMHETVEYFLIQHDKKIDGEELAEAILYQRLVIPGLIPLNKKKWRFKYNFPEFFKKIIANEQISLFKEEQTLFVHTRNFHNSQTQYAKEVLLFGRKSGMITEIVEWKKENGNDKYWDKNKRYELDKTMAFEASI